MYHDSEIFSPRLASSIRVRAVHSGSLANGECPYSALMTLSTLCGPLFVTHSIIPSAVCTVLALSLVHRTYVDGIYKFQKSARSPERLLVTAVFGTYIAPCREFRGNSSPEGRDFLWLKVPRQFADLAIIVDILIEHEASLLHLMSWLVAHSCKPVLDTSDISQMANEGRSLRLTS